MTGLYSSAKWCKTPTECLQLEPGMHPYIVLTVLNIIHLSTHS